MFPFFLFLSLGQAEEQPNKSHESFTLGYQINLLPMMKHNPDFNSETTEDTTWFTKQGVRLNATGK